MAKNDIYNNKVRYERVVQKLKQYILPPEKRPSCNRGNAKYFIKHAGNLKYFYEMIDVFEFKDTSYARRVRLLSALTMICHVHKKDLKEWGRPEINKVIAHVHTTYNSPNEKKKFIRDLKYFWRCLFPELDDKGRIDETKVPYVVRHLSAQNIIDKSEEVSREDRLYFDTYRKIMEFFNDDWQTQFFIAIALESLRRPQEILYRKIKNLECHDNYAKIYLTDHGKKGPGLIQCVDSYPYLLKHLERHPFPNDPEAYLFVQRGRKTGEQEKPGLINRKLKKACKHLNIQQRITCYSLKRNGVTYRELRGDKGFEIQHTAGWSSQKQLKTYDLSGQEDALRSQLARRGFLDKEATEECDTSPKRCEYCNTLNGFTETVCRTCKRPLERKAKHTAAEQEQENKEAEDVLKWLMEDEDVKKLIDTKIKLTKMNKESAIFRTSPT